MSLFDKNKLEWIPIVIGMVFTLLFAFFLFVTPAPISGFLHFLDNGAYDFQVKHLYRPVSKDLPILIVDVDDESILKEGRWPWPRKKIASLISKLFDLDANVVALDFIFSEVEKNIAEEVSKELNLSQETKSELEQQKGFFDFDDMLAKSLKQGNSILGFVFKPRGTSSGVLPTPLLTLDPSLSSRVLIPDLKTYLGNIESLQQAAKGGAFINASPDLDGVSRFSPLVLKSGDQIFPCLGLEAVRHYLRYKEPHLILQDYEDFLVMEGIQFDQMVIPTDPYGQILIPYRGPPYSIPSISAADVLNGSVKKSAISNRLIFIGSSATAMGDLVATPIAPVYAGVEVHADIASGILDNYLPSKPAWGKGVAILLVLILGGLFALLLPFMEPIGATFFSLIIGVTLLGLNIWLWTVHQLVISVVFPLCILFVIYLFNMIWGYLFERKKKQEAIAFFGEYVPPEFIKQMLKRGEPFSLEGETKELTVLFADIRQFTSLSESMSAVEVKRLLNEYLTQMTQVIFDHKGTIDKYVGDMVMAFWGAPVEDPQNAYDAVSTGLDMQKALALLNETQLKKQGIEIHIGVGINTGLMNVGDMGSKFRRAYTVIGDAVNLASRLEGVCKYYHAQVVVGEETFKQTEKSILYRKLDRIRVKGKTQAITIYEPLCLMDQCNPAVCRYAAVHNKAIETYFQQNWESAEKEFKALLENDPDHKTLYQVYLDRIHHFQKNPPTSDWDGVFIFDTKD